MSTAAAALTKWSNAAATEKRKQQQRTSHDPQGHVSDREEEDSNAATRASPPSPVIVPKIEEHGDNTVDGDIIMDSSKGADAMTEGNTHANTITPAASSVESRILISPGERKKSKEMVHLTSKEGETFSVDLEIAQMSKLVVSIMEEDQKDNEHRSTTNHIDISIDSDFDRISSEIPLPKINAPILLKVIQFCNHHHHTPMNPIIKPIQSTHMIHNVTPSWYAHYVNNIEMHILFELILAENYMDISPLLDLTCAKVASMIKGKTVEEIRGTFDIVNDFSPEEEERIRGENGWLEDRRDLKK